MENNSNKKKKHFLYSLFNPEGNGKGVDKIPDGPDNIKKCFAIYKRNLTNMLYLNLILIFGNFPIMFFLITRAGFFANNSTRPVSSLYSVLHGIMLHNPSPTTMALNGVYGQQASFSYPTITTYILIALTLLVIFTIGPVRCGVTYIMRSMVRRDAVFFKQDFFGSIKKNFPQCLIVGILDGLSIFLLIYGMVFYKNYQSTLFYVNIIVFSMYMMMRFYLYPLMITFKLSIWKLFKNSVIFMIIAFKRNIVAYSGCILMFIIAYFLLALYYPIGIIFPFVVMFSSCVYFGTFAAYPKIKEIMIDPYYANNPKTDE